jgi:uncharacterized Zn finger protein/superfamily II DNA or RNA helicase
MPWYFEKRPAPKAAAGATRKSYGTTWWGKQWLQALENIDYSNRLPRGRTYANKGLVQNLHIQGNAITAQVQGSMPKPYKISLTVPVFDAKAQENLLRIVTENPLFLSKLLNRELPPELNEACHKQGIHIFPRRWDDLKGTCSCPDYAVPCKHLAAALYIVANEIDKNPFVVFDLHNFKLVEALQTAGYTEDAQEDVPMVRLDSLQQNVADSVAFVFDDARLAALDLSVIPDCRDNLLRLLSERPVFYPEGDFKKLLADGYKNTATALNKAGNATTDLPHEQLTNLLNVEQTYMMLDANTGAFEFCALLDQTEDTLFDFESVGALVQFLSDIPAAHLALCSPELRALHLVSQLAETMAARGAFVPQILNLPAHQNKACRIRFIPALLNDQIRNLLDQARPLIAPELLFYNGKTATEPIESDYLPALLSVFLGHFVAAHAGKPIQEGILPRWFFTGTPTVFDRFENREYPKAVHLWLSRFFISEKDIVPVFEVHDDDDRFEVKVSIEDKTAPMQAPIPLSDVFAVKKHARLRLDALRDLSMVADFFPPLANLIASKGADRLVFDAQTFVDVFFNALPVIRLFGIRVMLPKALQKMLRPAASMALSAKNKGKIEGTGLLSLAALIDFQWQIALGDQVLDPEAFLKLIKKTRGIVRLADGYAFLDDKEIAALLEKIEHSAIPSGPKLLQIALAGEYEGAPVHLDDAARALIAELLRPDATPLPTGIHAILRPYQQRGFEWLYKNTRLGLGSLIADDMGLGKTLQIITLFQRLKEDGALGGTHKAIVVVPTTLLTNWTKEINRFAPDLRTWIYHGAGRDLTPLAEADILLTTYGVVRTEIAGLQKMTWAVVVVDEAQNIKNLDTAQTKAVKKLHAPVRIAMSGTPVENRLSEYFSILDFSNHGYLGSLKEFTATYAKPIELQRNKAALSRFRDVTSPFLLRRMKTDKTIISDLPDKIEANQFCTLTPEQAALYQNVVNQSLEALEKDADSNIKRQGLVLKMLTALKQVCNHPAHFLKKPAADPALSGKTQLLLDLLAQILESGEKTLIFTQYREMGDLLVPLIEQQLGVTPAFLHGGCSRPARDAMVDAFQNNRSSRILLLSLKAGGTGLNLTAASNVIHYDLWWNPAVEAQATDRAFRIGQQRQVMVHRFITQGTFEEKIDAMIQSKKELADLTVANGEKWVGDLSDQELRELVRLG